jgi:hypothetical protein
MSAINPSNKQRQRAMDDAIQTRMSAKFENRLRIELAKTVRQVADAFEKRGELAISQAIDDRKLAMAQAFATNYRTVASYFGKRILTEAKSHPGADVTKAGIMDIFNRALETFILEWVARRVTQIDRTTENQIRTVIRNGYDEGLSVVQIGKNIRDYAAPMSATRANIIARTETHTAANYGAQAGAELTGLKMQKEWVSAQDERTRTTPPDEFDHADADGQVVGMNEAFDVGGEQLMFPGDPSASAGNLINCRCAVVYLTD